MTASEEESEKERKDLVRVGSGSPQSAPEPGCGGLDKV
jgi:hypothetical protein